jgi:hypothetical protein
MKKVSYAKLALSLLLASSVLVGCVKGTDTGKNQAPQTSPSTITESPQLEEINIAFHRFKIEQKKFLNGLDGLINVPLPFDRYRENISIVDRSVTHRSVTLSETIRELKGKIQEFRQFRQTQLLKEEENVLIRLNITLDEISRQVIDPFKQGFNRRSIENVQRNLNFFEKNNISDKYYGNFGPATFTEITKFLHDEQKSLEYNIKELNSLDIVRSIPSSNVDFKKESLIVATLTLLASAIYWLKFCRKSNQNLSIIELLNSQKNPNNKWLNRFNLWTQNTHKDDQKKNTNNASTTVNIQNINKNQVKENNNNFYEKVSQDLEDDDQVSTEEIRRLKKRIEDLESCLQANENLEVREQTDIPSEPPDSQSSPSPQFSESNSSNYSGESSDDRDSLSSSLIYVYPTEESLANRLRGSSEPIILENKRRGSYGVYLDGNYHCLVPSQYFRINQNNYKSVEDLFECQNYDPNYSDSYTVIRPAVVYPLAGGQTWQLQKRGVLRF